MQRRDGNIYYMYNVLN